MPCSTRINTNTDTDITAHRPRSEHHPPYNAMVARLLTAKEVSNNPKALQAILEEGEKLLKQGVWDITTVSVETVLKMLSDLRRCTSHDFSYLFRKGQ